MDTRTPEQLLSDAELMDSFIRELHRWKLCNANGFSHRNVRYCYFGDDILLKSNNHIDNICSISIASKRGAKLALGSQDPRANGNPDPYLEGAKFVEVWRNGSWVDRGPWEEPIKQLLAKLIRRLELEEEREEYRKQKEKEAQLAAERARKEALIQEWS